MHLGSAASRACLLRILRRQRFSTNSVAMCGGLIEPAENGVGVRVRRRAFRERCARVPFALAVYRGVGHREAICGDEGPRPTGPTLCIRIRKRHPASRLASGREAAPSLPVDREIAHAHAFLAHSRHPAARALASGLLSSTLRHNRQLRSASRAAINPKPAAPATGIPLPRHPARSTTRTATSGRTPSASRRPPHTNTKSRSTAPGT